MERQEAGKRRVLTVLRLQLQATVAHEAVFVQSLCDVVAEVGDGVDDGGSLSSRRVVFLHQVVLLGDEVQRVVGDTVTVHLQGDGIVHQHHQTTERKEEVAFWLPYVNFSPYADDISLFTDKIWLFFSKEKQSHIGISNR